MEIAKGSARIPAYNPYLVPKLRPHPRMPNKTDRPTSLEDWGGRKQAMRRISPNDLPINGWITYRMFLLFAADGCKDIDSCGGLCGQLNVLSAALNLAVAEGVDMAIA